NALAVDWTGLPSRLGSRRGVESAQFALLSMHTAFHRFDTRLSSSDQTATFPQSPGAYATWPAPCVRLTSEGHRGCRDRATYGPGGETRDAADRRYRIPFVSVCVLPFVMVVEKISGPGYGRAGPPDGQPPGRSDATGIRLLYGKRRS